MNKLTQNSPGICTHCYADQGLHQFETMKCPKNPGRDDNKFTETTYENYKWRQVADQAQDMLAVLQQCHQLTADLNAAHFINPKQAGAQDMIQRIKAMQPRIYNLIKPLQ